MKRSHAWGLNTAINAAGIALAFNPINSALGGITLGLAAVGNMALNGRNTRPGKIVNEVLDGKTDAWRYCWLGGLLLSSVGLRSLLPSCFQSLSDSFPIWRAVVAGAALGIGSGMADSDELGALTGVARGSNQDIVNLVAFMAAAAVTARAAQSGSEIGIPPGKPTYNDPSQKEVNQRASTLAVGAAMILALFFLGKKSGNSDQRDALALVSEVGTGMLFATGLGLSGILKPQVSLAFFSVTEDFWNASLPFVYGGAVALVAAGYWLLKDKVKGPANKHGYEMPGSSKAENKHIVGALLQGVGTGLSGFSVAPALATLAAAPSKPLLALNGSMAVGAILYQKLLKEEVKSSVV